MDSRLSPEEFLRASTHAARHFGFSTIETLRQDPSCRESADRIQHNDTAKTRKTDALHGLLTGGMSSYFDHKLNAIEGPALFYTIDQVPRTNDPAVSFQLFNVKKSIGEALLIQTIRSVLNDLGLSNHVVRINSLGDTDSLSRYLRELNNFLKKKIDDMPPVARELMKEHPILALLHLIDKDHDLAKRSPNPMEYLTDASRKHFREIVEFLDMSNIPFEIDQRLIGHHECYSDTLFSFELLSPDGERMDPQPLSIRGGRYSTFVQKMTRTKIPAMGAVLVLENAGTPKISPTHLPTFESSVFVVQLGFRPKVRSLTLIEDLKCAGISVYQNVISDSLSEQLREAESKNVRYAVIIGQKEYVEGKAILRDLKERSQENVPLTSLATSLRRVTGTL